VRAILRERLWVPDAGALRAELVRWAWVRRTGRLRAGEPRWVPLWVDYQGTLGLPRELWRWLQRRYTWAAVEDRRLAWAPQPWPWRGQLRPYQVPAVEWLAKAGGGILVAPPGSGKTVMGLYLAGAVWGQPTLWLVHTLDLQRQALERAWSLFAWSRPQEAIGWIGAGTYHPGQWLTVATVQTLYEQPQWLRALVGRVGTVVVDECHHAPARIYQSLLHRFPARYRLGLSATPQREDGMTAAMTATLGARVAVPRAALVDAAAIVLPRVVRVDTGWQYHGHRRWAAMELARALDTRRNQRILRIILAAWQRQRRTLVLVERRDHVALLGRWCQRMGIPAIGLAAEVGGPKRARAWAALEAGRAVVIATKLANEGVDIPALDCLILAAPGRSHARLEQQVGRAMRAVPGKPPPEVWDCCDPGVPAYARHAKRRLAWYMAQGYPILAPQEVLGRPGEAQSSGVGPHGEGPLLKEEREG